LIYKILFQIFLKKKGRKNLFSALIIKKNYFTLNYKLLVLYVDLVLRHRHQRNKFVL